jgi:Cu-Zn family superoxide dismutase
MEENMLRLSAALLLAGVAPLALAQDAPEESRLSLPIFSKDEKPAGLLEMTDTPNGVLIVVTFEPDGLPAGEHAMHIHETGDCTDVAEGFKKAGAHYDPSSAEHGYKPEAGPHAGDLPNVTIVAGEQTKVSAFSPRLRFSEGDAPLFDDDGSALVIHAAADDYESQPSGNAGDRIACTELTGG